MLLISFITACALPFDVFLFSYAVLGPLHYLTELQWLRNKNFFLQKSDVRAFIFFAVLIAALLFLPFLKICLFRADIFSGIILSIFFIFCSYLLFVLKNRTSKLFLGALILFVGLLYFFKPSLIILLGLFIPTLIHVYVFTVFFMTSGYFKNPDSFGLINIVLLLSVPFVIYFMPVEHFVLSGINAEKIFNSTGFKIINDQLTFFFGKNISKTNVVLKAQIFIAFAYTYHYLNWFAKTSVIGWAKSLELKKMILVLGIWILSIALYLYNYQTGLTVLFVLSMIHVLAEFPLNALSVKTIFQKIISKK